jgi:hypothetical protein
MIQRVSVPVSVQLAFDHKKRKVWPQTVVWEGIIYPIHKIGLHHCYTKGKTLYHIFSVASDGVFFKLSFNTDNLFWELEEISDGLPE